MNYRVTGPLVLVRSATGQINHVYQGDLLPHWTDDEQIQRLLADKFIAPDAQPDSLPQRD